MKVNYQRKIEQGVKKTTLLSSTIIIIIVATVIGATLIKTEYNNFKTHIENFKTTLIEREKFYIKTAVENLVSDMKFEEEAILNSKKERIEKQSIIAYNLAYSLYEKTKNLSKDEQINFIKNSIKQISKKQSDINYFILNTSGRLILNSENNSDENEVFLDFEDINGLKFINKMIDSNKDKQNFIEYFWYKPNSNITAKKITYTRHLKELGIIIGSGSFLEVEKNKLKKRISKKIFNQNYNTEEFVLIYKINSLNNIASKSDLLTQKHIISSKVELKAMEDLLIETNYKGNDYIYFDNKRKLLYGTFVTNLRYFIGIGVDLTQINNIIKKERATSIDNLSSKILKLAIIILIMTVIFFMFSLGFTRKIEKLFIQYRQTVKQNEEKYALLFNYSNDGFIISQMKEDKTLILSLNKTALKITGYESSEILEQEFFDLFNNLDLEETKKSKSLSKTVKLVRKNKEIRTIELNIIVYSYENQNLLFASLRDITERTLLKEEKLKQQNILIQKSKMAAMGEMIGNIAHQWRQPLSQISGLFFDIESAYDYKELDKKYLSQRVDDANDLLEYMSKTIDDFRNFFNPTSKKEEFLIQDAVFRAIKILKSTLEHHKIDIQIQCDKKYKIYGYKNEYLQAIVNIISNAKDILVDQKIKNAKIKVYVKEIDDEIILFIEDNAGGIDASIMDKIFDPYFTTKYEYGTGIGLYMTKLIIEEKMNGVIKVENLNDGAVFSIKV
ncbi:histidine kinase [Poseidonibacter parvus]|uniref:histidine kinase n=1 Tax=Poseidonibacter parvus TaxID=1850254 RepID=A0A1P8KJ48_9BACT|nr:cache domain-containing protein [Poseidonibacter parvus]APW64578.1 histidine kinase [Poseidonibacter parvus]